MKTIDSLYQAGQSLWYDNIQRKLLENSDLAGMIARGEIRGVTSNPSIFNAAIAKSTDYDAALTPMAWAGWNTERIFNQLAVEDIRAAADLFLPLYQQSNGGDGYVSLEVSPGLARNTQGTLVEARQLWQSVNRPNLMVKIPATREGLPAISDAIAAGINVNVTLIFGRERYQAVMEAYLRGLEQRAADGLPISGIASVASFFISRVDTLVDARLESVNHAELQGKAAIANAKLAYADYRAVFGSERFARLKALGAQVQRPLWASTSTKNPDYSDVMYIEELIGNETVNTVPPQTLAAYIHHGKVKENSLISGVEAAQAAIDAIEAAGVSMQDVTQQLEEEGVKSFADAYQALIATIDERRQNAVDELGPLADGVAQRIAHLEAIDMPRRIWAHDASLWTEDEAGQAELRKRMGWLDAPQRSRSLIPELKTFVKGVQAAGFTHVLLMGMGGSSLAPEVMSMVFGTREVNGQSGLELQILDSTDPGQVRAAARWSPIDRTLYVVASKSGTTSEVNAFMEYFWARARRRLGDKAAEHFIAITDPNTAMEKLARERKFRHVFLADPSVGGRNSALTAFGLVPAALLGVDPETFLARGAWMAEQCGENVPAGRNPALVLGALMGEAYLQGRDKLTILADAPVASLGGWMEQLIAESSGKQGKGIVPVDLEPPMRPKRYSDDRYFVYLKLAGDGGMESRAADLRNARLPVVTLTLRDTLDLPAQFFLWEYATAVACSVLGVNSFDQPDVQDNKDRTNSKVKYYQEHHTLEETQPIWEGAGGRVYGWDFPGLNGCKTLSDVVKMFVEQSRAGDYIAINAYVPRNTRNANQLQTLRGKILKLTEKATTLGFGPRFLHSTGQLHKGGAQNGMFLQITGQPEATIEIPGSGMAFGKLERAQALGDLEALLARGKRAIRVHLTDGSIKDLI